MESYEVATIIRLPKNIGLFCKRALSKRRYPVKETYILKEPTNHSHPICIVLQYPPTNPGVTVCGDTRAPGPRKRDEASRPDDNDFALLVLALSGADP